MERRQIKKRMTEKSSEAKSDAGKNEEKWTRQRSEKNFAS